MDLLVEYALSFVGTPYKWGGDDPMSGLDCSGFIQELLSSVGIDPPGDQTAKQLFDYFKVNGRAVKDLVYRAGDLAFYGKDEASISHIAMLVSPLQIIEAGGGGSKTVTLEDAKRDNAFIRIRPLNRRRDLVAVLRPTYFGIPL